MNATTQQFAFAFARWVEENGLDRYDLNDAVWQEFLATPAAMALAPAKKPRASRAKKVVAEGEQPEEKPKRKYTRKPKETPVEATGEEREAATAEKPQRKYTRKPKETPVEATSEASEASEASEVEKPKRKYTRKPKATPVEATSEASDEVVGEEAADKQTDKRSRKTQKVNAAEQPTGEEKPKRKYTRKSKTPVEEPVVVIAPQEPEEPEQLAENEEELANETYEEEWTEYYKDGVLYYKNEAGKWLDAQFNPCDSPI